MSTTTTILSEDSIPLSQIESELTRQLGQGKNDANAPLLRTRLSNLVVFCSTSQQAELVTRAVPEIVASHPARVLLLVGEDSPETPLTACLNIWSQPGGKSEICSEQVTLRAAGPHVEQLPFAVRELLIGDLPTNLWWVAPMPPPLAGQFLYELAEHAQQVIYDSLGWATPAAGVAATSAWLARLERTAQEGPWRVAADLNWRRLKIWRRTLSQALDPSTAPGTLESITEVLVEHGPHAAIQAWVLVSWLASRLGWSVKLGKVCPGVEITWQVVAPHGMVKVRMRRLSEGGSEVRKVRIAYNAGGTPRALNVAAENGMRLAIVLEGEESAPRTVAAPQQSLAELVIHQLSNRDSDPVFRESMAVAEVFARTVLE